MNKFLKIFLIVIACVFVVGIMGGLIAFFITGNTANADEYKLGNDTIRSIKSVVEKRTVSSVSSEIANGISIKKIKYSSNTVQEDLVKYTQYLRNEGGFVLTKNMDLTVVPSIIELTKKSNETGKIVMMIIDYDMFGYTITIKKGEGTLNIY